MTISQISVIRDTIALYFNEQIVAQKYPGRGHFLLTVNRVEMRLKF